MTKKIGMSGYDVKSGYSYNYSLGLDYIDSEKWIIEDICSLIYKKKLFRRTGQLQEWVTTDGFIKYGMVVVDNGKYVACGVINIRNEIALYVQVKYRKQHLGSKIIEVLLNNQDGILYGLPDWDRYYDYNAGFWNKIAKRYPRIQLR